MFSSNCNWLRRYDLPFQQQDNEVSFRLCKKSVDQFRPCSYANWNLISTLIIFLTVKTPVESIVAFDYTQGICRCVVILSPASRQVRTFEEDTGRREKEARGKTEDVGKSDEFSSIVRSVSLHISGALYITGALLAWFSNVDRTNSNNNGLTLQNITIVFDKW